MSEIKFLVIVCVFFIYLNDNKYGGSLDGVGFGFLLEVKIRVVGSDVFFMVIIVNYFF